ncbi:MAG: type II toxin-antitoxin system PemK/MazF family toxin [Candidatus Poribacteria bacterium]|nr:type II toxin-antitoxin system PemK/MazF family toxin [Candidatus Poribacteria bacterium]
MRESSIVLVPLLQADEELKYRPAIVLREMPLPYRDLFVCGVSTRLNQYVQGLDDIISPTDADFISSGLHSESLIRLSFLGVIPRRLVRGILGNISEERHERLLRSLIDYLVGSENL